MAITQAFLKNLFSYAPDTGIFRWMASRPPRGKVGAIAGYDCGHGYIKLSIGGKRYYAHRMAFLWMTGRAPKEVDHINQCRSDNRWVNLRASNREENCANVRGRLGVRQRHGRWYARFGKKHLGSFATKAQAIEARQTEETRRAGNDPNNTLPELPLKLLKRKHRHLLYKGKTLSEWARITGLRQATLHHRIYQLGLSPQQAISLPLRRSL